MSKLEGPRAPARYADRETPLIENAWYVAGFSDEVGRTLLARRILGIGILLYRRRDGKPVALDNRCPHRSFPLSKGQLDGDDVVCGYHGIAYGPDGGCVRIPALPHAPAGFGVRHYPTAERGPIVWIWMGAPERADETLIPPYAAPEAPGWAYAKGYVQIAANYVGLHENLVDLTHFPFLHKDIGIGSDAFLKTKMETKVEGGRVHGAIRTLNAPPPAAYVRALDLPADQNVDRISEFGFVAPGLSAGLLTLRRLVAAAGKPDVYLQHTLHFITPETQNSTHYFWFVVRDFEIESEVFTAATAAATERAFFEDRDALEWIQELVAADPRTDFREFSFATDRSGLQTRQLIQELADVDRAATMPRPPAPALRPTQGETR